MPAAKKPAPKKPAAKKPAAKKAKAKKPVTLKVAANDNLSEGFGNQIPQQYRGSDQFLDIVTWNIRFFHDKDPARIQRVVDVLTALNADVFVFEEILDGSLAPVAQGLGANGAGNYLVDYGTTGGNQRVAMMWDIDWIRTKDNVAELFGKGQVKTQDGKDAFPRLPLLGVFTSLSTDADPFDFQLLGLHLKSQRGGGGDQRRLSARKLRDWLIESAPAVDADVILLGDWNEDPDSATWEPFRELEQDGKAVFTSLNDNDQITHLMYKNKQHIGSRLDLAAISKSTMKNLQQPPQVVRWKSLDALLATNPKAAEIKKHIRFLSDNFSDHMPVVTRFYFEAQP